MARIADPNLRIDLLAAAEAAFIANGVDHTRIDDIVLRAGRSKGAFYQYFTNKEDIFRQIVEGLLARLATLVAKPLLIDEKQAWTPKLFFDQWRLRDEAIFEFVWANRALVRLILRGGYSAHFGDLMDAFARRTYDVIVDSVEWAKEHRVYRKDFDTHVVSVLIAGAYDRLARELADTVDDRPDIRHWVAQAQAFVLRGIIDSSVENPPRPPATGAPWNRR
jgi:AcrR family transcriptional regulator